MFSCKFSISSKNCYFKKKKFWKIWTKNWSKRKLYNDLKEVESVNEDYWDYFEENEREFRDVRPNKKQRQLNARMEGTVQNIFLSIRSLLFWWLVQTYPSRTKRVLNRWKAKRQARNERKKELKLIWKKQAWRSTVPEKLLNFWWIKWSSMLKDIFQCVLLSWDARSTVR